MKKSNEKQSAEIIQLRKGLYKSPPARFSHYTAGTLYYTVELPDGIFQFPISEDLGTTTFSAEIKATELWRWMEAAIESGEFIKIK